MTSIAYSPVSIQTTSRSDPSTPSWFGEVTLLTHSLRRHGVLSAMEEQVCFARRRFGRYEVIDFLAVFRAIQSAVNGRWKPFTSGAGPGQTRSWRSSGATVCPRVQP
ncbi:MAG: hypothetical protein ABI406_13070 [Ktedonobacteraceae bacterium]